MNTKASSSFTSLTNPSYVGIYVFFFVNLKKNKFPAIQSNTNMDVFNIKYICACIYTVM
jgi:hypothetical protein